MEAELLTKILAGGGGATTAIWFIYSMIKKRDEEAKEFKKDVKETLTVLIAKFDKLTDSINSVVLISSSHAKDIEYGEKRFVKIEDEQANHRKAIHDFREELHKIKNIMVTQDHLREIRQ